MASTQVYQVHIIHLSMFDMQDMKIKFHTTYSNIIDENQAGLIHI